MSDLATLGSKPDRRSPATPSRDARLATMPFDPLSTERLESGDLRWLRALGKHGQIVPTVALAIPVSLVITIAAFALFGLPSDDNDLIGLAIAVFASFIVAIAIAYSVMQRIEHQLMRKDQQRHQATHDSPTGLRNRRWILKRVEQAVASSTHAHQPIGVLVVEIDHFNVISEQLGHQAGNMVLQAIAQRLRRMLRQNDCLGRYDAAQFLLLTHGVSPQALNSCAERMRTAIGRDPIPYGRIRLPVTISIGAAIIATSLDATALASALHHADQALAQAKANGRNCAEISVNP